MYPREFVLALMDCGRVDYIAVLQAGNLNYLNLPATPRITTAERNPQRQRRGNFNSGMAINCRLLSHL
jgi:hypothetical protein